VHGQTGKGGDVLDYSRHRLRIEHRAQRLDAKARNFIDAGAECDRDGAIA
jgi:hypothetical protein